MKHLALLIALFTMGSIEANTSLSNYSDLAVGAFKTESFAFEENMGQVSGKDANRVKFRLNTGSGSIFLLNNAISYQFLQIEQAEKASGVFDAFDGNIKGMNFSTHRMDMQLIGANENPRISKLDAQNHYTRYSTTDLEKVYTYEKVIYHDIYPNIDWVFFINETGIKHEFIVHPGGNPALIKFDALWVDDLNIDNQGNLILKNRLGQVIENSPVSFQGKQVIETKFVLNDRAITYTLKDYDKRQTLRIDPQLIWGSYYGGESTEGINSVTTDSQGNVYFCGSTQSFTGIADGGFLNNNPLVFGFFTSFLVKFTPEGDRIWGTYYGGTGFTTATGCAVDSEDNIYLAGGTSDLNNIAFDGYQNSSAGDFDGMLVKFNPEGERIWGTYFGGSQSESFLCITIDQADNIYLAGETLSLNLPVLNAYQSTASAETGLTSEGIVVKFNVAGELLASTYFGGTGADRIFGIDHNASGDIFVAGSTTSTDLPTLNAHQGTIGSTFSNTPFDAFLAKFNAGSDLAWSTYYGGSDSDVGYSCAADHLGNVYLSGNTGSQNNIAFGGFQNSIAPGSASFLVKFNQNGVRQWGTYYGFSADDWPSNANFGWGCATDSENNVYMVGRTRGTTNVAFQGFQNALSGFSSTDGYIAKFSTTGTRLWASYYGGNDNDGLRGCHVDPSNQLYVVGQTNSSNNVFFQGFQSTQENGTGYIAKIGCPTPQLVNLPTEICANSSLQLSPFPAGGTLQLIGTGALNGANYTAPNVSQSTGVSIQYGISAGGFCPSDTSTFSFTVLPNTIASVNIAASNLVICENNEVIFLADIENAGSSPAIQWLVNEVLVAENQADLASTAFTDGDVVQCIVQSTNICASPSTVESNSVEITVNPNPVVNVVFNEINGGLVIASTGFSTYQWFLNGSEISGATNSSYVLSENGLYSVLVANEFGCESSASVFVSTLSASVLIEEGTVAIYPNPNDGNFSISFYKVIPQRISLHNPLGKLIYETRDIAPTQSFSFPNLSAGVYFISVFTDEMKKQYKVVVQ